MREYNAVQVNLWQKSTESSSSTKHSRPTGSFSEFVILLILDKEHAALSDVQGLSVNI